MEDTEELSLHRCILSGNDSDSLEHGAAITEVYETSDGRLAVSNNEYGSYVNYCPVCGYKAKVPVRGTEEKWTKYSFEELIGFTRWYADQGYKSSSAVVTAWNRYVLEVRKKS